MKVRRGTETRRKLCSAWPGQGATRENTGSTRPRSNATRRDVTPVECSGLSRRAARSQGRTSFLHESSSVTSATRPRRQISRPCSERWVRSRKSFFRSTASPIDRVDLPSSSSGMRQRSPRRSSNSMAPSSTDEISGSARPGTVRHGHPGEGGSWTTARRPWTSGADPRNRKAAVAAFEAENAGFSSVSPLHANPLPARLAPPR